jgi:squalene-hopene/tetraprenyl-beta-curcumene cyclase
MDPLVTPVTADESITILDGEARIALDRARLALLDRQRPDGHWVGELEGDSILASEYVLLLAFLGREIDPRLGQRLRDGRRAAGGWACYPDGPVDVSVSVKAYFALKILGDAETDPLMIRDADAIRAHGGAAASNSFTRFYLALLGQMPWTNCPAVPVEMILLPKWFPINIYAFSAWSRTIVVPLAVVNAYRPVTRLPDTQGIRELFLDDPATPWRPAQRPPLLSWARLFLGIDAVLKFKERLGWHPLRRRALRLAMLWMCDRIRNSDGLGAIFPPMIYTAIVWRCVGLKDDEPEVRAVHRELDRLKITDGDTQRLQPCLSPVWDTALSLIALADAGEAAESPAIRHATQWLIQREIRTPGDWAETVRGVEPSGWCFEYANTPYPDTDDTSMVLMALARHDRGDEPAARRGIAWLFALQNRDGGWAAFDRGITRHILTQVPFADHNAMLDPSCPDITARVLECLSHYGYRCGHPAVDRGVAFVLREQDADGPWWGRWGVNYIYGTWQVLVGLQAVGFDMTRPVVRRAVRWLKDVQNSDGGWGESCRSYDDRSHAGIGESTASQTAWALLGLHAAGEANTPETDAGIKFLLATQADDGTWPESAFTGTGFPRVFYLRYHMYPHYFPMMALGKLSSLRE